MPTLRVKVFGRNALKVYSIPDDVPRIHLPRDRVSQNRAEYSVHADSSFVTHGPKTRREFLTLKA